MASTFFFQPPFIAHRGVSIAAPENTMAAFRLAAENGAKWIEFDVHLTHDGVPIVMHDDTLERTSNGKGAVENAKWADVQALDAGSWFDKRFKGERVPQLAEVLRYALDSNLQPMIEIKPCAGRAQATTMVTLIEAAKIWPQDHKPPAVLSFDREVLGIAAKFQPHWPRGISFEEWQEDWQEQAAKAEATLISFDEKLLSRERVHTLSHSGLTVLAYTVNEAARARELLQLGVRAIFTDDPKTLIQAT